MNKIIDIINNCITKNEGELISACGDGNIIIKGYGVPVNPLDTIQPRCRKVLVGSLFDSESEYRDGEKLCRFISQYSDGGYSNTVADALESAYYALLVKRIDGDITNTTFTGNTWKEILDILCAYHVTEDRVFAVMDCDRTLAYEVLAARTKAAVDPMKVLNTFKMLMDQVIGSNNHRGLHFPKINILTTTLYDVMGEWTEETVEDEDGNPVVNGDGTTKKAYSVHEMELLSLMSKNVKQSRNRFFEIVEDEIARVGFELGNYPMTINMAMQGDNKVKGALRYAVDKCKELGDDWDEIRKYLVSELDKMSSVSEQQGYEELMSKSLFESGFMYRGVHYTNVMSTQAQIRGGSTTFVIDPKNMGALLMARILHRIFVGLDGIDEIIAANEGKSNKDIADAVLYDIQEKVSKMNGIEHKIKLSKALGRPGLTASNAIDIRSIAENNTSDVSRYFKDLMEHAEVLTVDDGAKVEVKADAKSIELEPMQKPSREKTHRAKLVNLKDVKFSETAADGELLVDLGVGAAISFWLHYIDEEESRFFINNWVESNKYEYDTDTLYKAAKRGDKEAIKLVKIIKKIRTCIQLRLPGGETEGFGVKGAAVVAPIKHNPKLTAIGRGKYDAIIPDSCIKFFRDGTNICLLDIRVCNTNKGHDLYTHKARMSAQYMGALVMSNETAARISDICINDIVGALDTNGSRDSAIDSLISLGVTGTKQEFNAFNEAKELVKANPKMRYDKRFMAHLRSWAANEMCEVARSAVPVQGDYLMQVCDPYATLNIWFADDFAAKGVSPFKTLMDYAKEQGVTTNVFFVNGYSGLIGVFRSPQNSRFEGQRGNAVSVECLWWLNDVLVHNATEAIWRLLGGSDFDGDKVLVILYTSEVNRLIIDSIAMTKEVKIDPKEIGAVIGAEANKMAMTVDNIVKLMVEISHKSRIGQIAKWSSAQLAMVTHLSTAAMLARKHGCYSVCFVAPIVPAYNWKNSAGPKYAHLDQLHDKMVRFMSCNHSREEFEHALDVPNDFEGYVIDDGTLYLEGYIEMKRDEMRGIYPRTWRDREGNEHYCGLYGSLSVPEVEDKISYYLNANEVNSAAGSIEIDATNNGFSSFFHEKAGFMGAHELFRDILKGKDINPLMSVSTYYNIGTLGLIFANTMKRWNDVMGLLTSDNEVDMTDYLCMLLDKDQINAMLAKSKSLAKIKLDYSNAMNGIMEEFPEDDDERVDAIRELTNDTRCSLIDIAFGGRYKMNIETLALACYLMGEGKSFSFIFVEHLRSLIENDPTAIGITKLPKSFDAEKTNVTVENINGRNWICIAGAEDSKLYRAVNTSSTGSLPIRVDADGNSYTWYVRSASNNVAPNKRSLELTETNINNLRNKATVNIVLNQPLDDLSVLCNTGVNGTTAIYVYMEANGTVRCGLMNPANNTYSPLGVKFETNMNGLPGFTKSVIKACLVNHVIVLDLSKAKLAKNGTSIIGATVLNAQ